MGKLLRIGVMCLVGVGVTTAAASAQTTAVGYGFVSPAFATYEGDSLAIFQAGGGGEARLGHAFGLGADLGFAAPWEELSDSVGSLSLNGTYYVKGTNRSRRTQPFVTTGYTLLFRDGTVNGVNFGAGVDRWMTDRVGMRFEFRDHIMMQEGESFHLWGPRISIVWRK